MNENDILEEKKQLLKSLGEEIDIKSLHGNYIKEINAFKIKIHAYSNRQKQYFRDINRLTENFSKPLFLYESTPPAEAESSIRSFIDGCRKNNDKYQRLKGEADETESKIWKCKQETEAAEKSYSGRISELKREVEELSDKYKDTGFIFFIRKSQIKKDIEKREAELSALKAEFDDNKSRLEAEFSALKAQLSDIQDRMEICRKNLIGKNELERLSELTKKIVANRRQIDEVKREMDKQTEIFEIKTREYRLLAAEIKQMYEKG